MSKSLLDRQQGPLFSPSFDRKGNPSGNYIGSQVKSDDSYAYFKETNIESSSSFRYGNKPYLVSSQQLRIDYSNYENHTFFHSAVAKVNEGFDKLVNFYPFEKSRKEIEKFEDDLTGFEKYILNSFPKNTGYLNFSGSAPGESILNGTYIVVQDKSGASISSISDNNTGDPVLDPKLKPLSIELFLDIPEQVNDNQIIVQKFASYANNFTLALSQSSSTSNCDIIFSITSGSNYNIVTGSVNKGSFFHLTAMYDPYTDKKIKMLVDDTLYQSENSVIFNGLNYFSADLTIGKGENYRIGGTATFEQQQSFSGSMDDFKLFHDVFSLDDIKKRRYRSYYTPHDQNTRSIKLYYKFNEPYGEYTGNNILIDSSGNSLHTSISNYDNLLRLNTTESPVISEDVNRCPVLFPTYSDVVDLNTELLLTASLYDEYNPNLITKLVPRHYFQEATNFRDYTSELTNLNSNFENFSAGNLGQKKSEIPHIQLLMQLLLSYAKFFDELKLYIDAVTHFRHTKYEDYDTTPDPFLQRRAKILNIKLPNMFSDSSVEQALEGINLTTNPGISEKNLNMIQNLVWRRILSDAPQVNKARGTVRSIKSIFRNAGIEPDNILTFREYGGSKEKSLDASRELRRDVFNFINFKSSRNIPTTSTDQNGYPQDTGIPRIKTNFLSSSRIETGEPVIAGNFVNKSADIIHGISDNQSDGLLTSGSFTYEGLYVWENGYQQSESLIRFQVTGSDAPSNKEGCALNVVADNEKITLYVCDDPIASNVSALELSGVNIFDGGIWHVSAGKANSHDIKFKPDGVGQYFLRAAKQSVGELLESHVTASFFNESADSVFKNITAAYNASGSFLVVGRQELQEGTSNKLLNNNSLASEARITDFTGELVNNRFYSKYTSDEEFKNRSKNYSSFGVDDPKKNYNFTPLTTGSFERVVLHTDAKQASTMSDTSGRFTVFDFSQNNFHFEGYNFTPEVNVTTQKRVEYEILSDKFDLNYTKEKVRVRSFQDTTLVSQGYFATTAPVHEVLPSEVSIDDNRLSLDMSSMKGLNENILRVFSDLTPLEDALGKPNMLFDDSYKELKALREIYFNNLIEDLDLEKYRNMFKWIDNSFTDVVFSMLPKTTNFLGINFIYESHVLERNRIRYLYDDIYMLANERSNKRTQFLLSQFVGKIKRH